MKHRRINVAKYIFLTPFLAVPDTGASVASVKLDSMDTKHAALQKNVLPLSNHPFSLIVYIAAY